MEPIVDLFQFRLEIVCAIPHGAHFLEVLFKDLRAFIVHPINHSLPGVLCPGNRCFR